MVVKPINKFTMKNGATGTKRSVNKYCAPSLAIP